MRRMLSTSAAVAHRTVNKPADISRRTETKQGRLPWLQAEQLYDESSALPPGASHRTDEPLSSRRGMLKATVSNLIFPTRAGKRDVRFHNCKLCNMRARLMRHHSHGYWRFVDNNTYRKWLHCAYIKPAYLRETSITSGRLSAYTSLDVSGRTRLYLLSDPVTVHGPASLLARLRYWL